MWFLDVLDSFDGLEAVCSWGTSQLTQLQAPGHICAASAAHMARLALGGGHRAEKKCEDAL